MNVSIKKMFFNFCKNNKLIRNVLNNFING